MSEEVKNRFDRIDEMLVSQFGSDAARKNALLAKYPYGYAIIDMSSNSVVTLHDRILNRFQIDASRSEYQEFPDNTFRITTPFTIDTATKTKYGPDYFRGERRVG